MTLSFHLPTCVGWYRPAGVHENNTTTNKKQMSRALFSPKANLGGVQRSWHRYKQPWACTKATHTQTKEMDAFCFARRPILGVYNGHGTATHSLDIYNRVTWYRPASVHENNTTTTNKQMNNVLSSPKAICGSVQLSWHRYELPL